jgi:isopenicillin-N N-acyltransferase-like protein
MSTAQTHARVPETGLVFPTFRFTGSHREIGEQFGTACTDLIHRHLEKALARLASKSGVARAAALEKALAYRPYVLRYVPFLDDEIQGVAAGARISLAEAYLLQLRAEVATPLATPDGSDDTNECTTFAVLPEATSNGVTLVGQNADLPAFYGEIAVVAEITPDPSPRSGEDTPAVLMLLPAGQVSYIGINDRGLGVFANFVTCDGWRLGLPRYMLSRLALTQDSVDAAIAAVRAARRASSRNLIMADARGTAADLETTPARDARLDPEDGLLAHANHYVAEALLGEERSAPASVANSRIRMARMQELLREHHGRLDAATMQTIMRDRACYPDTICRAPSDSAGSDMMTFASVIAEPSEGRLSVAVGPPHENPYVTYQFSR